MTMSHSSSSSQQSTSLAAVVVAAFAGLAALARAAPLADAADADACDCYRATASSTAEFVNRRFFEFRTLSGAGVPATIDDAEADAAAGATNAYFSSAEWADSWGIQSWNTTGGPVWRVNSPNNVYIEQDTDTSGTYLTMRTVRQPGYSSTAEIESVETDYQFLSIRMLARTTGDPGAVTSMFTYLGSNPVQEADLEIRTMEDTDIINYTNQPGNIGGVPVPGATEAVAVPSPWTDWLEHRYDWTPGSSDWYVNGTHVASIQLQTPTDPLSVLFNVWSDGGSWSGNMTVGGEAQMQVRWVDLTYNTTADNNGGGQQCANVCVVDDLVPQ
ncbi:concanavalin A-like lectin/glucanase domain-containing protein [Xylariaceae sp. FL0804]|nr:concanavalin A-like lectin/glucanase domain-containing protein [Xylariaceae sp. FL0804]